MMNKVKWGTKGNIHEWNDTNRGVRGVMRWDGVGDEYDDGVRAC